MDQKILNMLATTSAEFHALGDDENSGMIMTAIQWLACAHDMPLEAIDQANSVYIDLRDLPITEIPEKGWPHETQSCQAALIEGCKELISGVKLLTECIGVLQEYWGALNENRN